MSGLLVVTPEEMKRLEQMAFAEGESEEKYMLAAGSGIAAFVEKHLSHFSNTDTVYLLIGKGNNGGDTFVLGQILHKKGFSVLAYHLFPIEECSALSQKMCERFLKSGGKRILQRANPEFKKGVIIDGLVGTGFQGAMKGMFAETIEAANRSGLPIFSVDIPSGLNASTGQVETVAIKAHTTIFLGLPKIGFYLGEGWNHVGRLVQVDFGMPERIIQKAHPVASLLSEEKAKQSLPKIFRTRHKYQTGYVLAVAGSVSMPGAALMACLAALKAGAGIVRLFFPQEMQGELSSAPYELIKESWDLKDDSRIFEEAKRAKALIIGPGMGRSPLAEGAVERILANTQLATVVDADGLFFLSKHTEMKLPENTILTPHTQEMQRILQTTPTLENCLHYVHEKKITLVLKGAPSIIFHPNALPLIVPRGDPGMAKAGTGDVLTGILAALLAQNMLPFPAATLGVFLHAVSGEIAAKIETSYGVLATDLITCLPKAIRQIQRRKL